MNNTSPQHMNTNNAAIFAQLSRQDVEEFYVNGFQYWNLQHQIQILQFHLNDVRKQITENTTRMHEYNQLLLNSQHLHGSNQQTA